MTERNQQFSSFVEWCNKASSWLTRHPLYSPGGFRAICVDAKGRRVSDGRAFQRAREDDAFPVRWIWPDQAATLVTALTEEQWAAFCALPPTES